MALNIVEKILLQHGVVAPQAGREIALVMDQTLTQDSTGTMAYLQLEAIGIGRVCTQLSVAYIDHNLLQCGFENADDHLYIQSVAAKHGIVCSKPGNGICHQVHIERFAKPGTTLIGSDSHTPTAGGVGALAIGAGGLDVALAMAGQPYSIAMPAVCRVHLTGRLAPQVSAKDVILQLLRVLTVKGGVGKIFEYSGPGVATLSVPERATIANMGAELGATTSIFPSDAVTLEFLRALGRECDYVELTADAGAVYADEIILDLSAIQPMIACPHSPDAVRTVSELAGMSVSQVCIGSCTNSSLADMASVADILRNHRVHPQVSLTISPGSRQVLTAMARTGILADMLAAGARILECGCGPCLGIGQSPRSAGVSLRTFNRNFRGRSGTMDAEIYLVGPQTAAFSALSGCLTDPRIANSQESTPPCADYAQYGNDNLLIFPPVDSQDIVVERGPNIKPVPAAFTAPAHLQARVLLVAGDNITTDHIMPSPAWLATYRSNIPYLADYCFSGVDGEFAARARYANGGVIVAGDNYGQGSSREHAALVPLYLGVKAVIAKSFGRIHRSNLINFGIVPLVFDNADDYESIQLMDEVTINNLAKRVAEGQGLILELNSKNITLKAEFSDRERDMLLAGGALNLARQEARCVKSH